MTNNRIGGYFFGKSWETLVNLPCLLGMFNGYICFSSISVIIPPLPRPSYGILPIAGPLSEAAIVEGITNGLRAGYIEFEKELCLIFSFYIF